MITAVTDVLPPTGAAWEPRRQIFITDEEKDATVTLWGSFATGFGADMLCNLSKREPVLVLFVGTMVDRYVGTLAMKNMNSTRWHVNVDIPQMKATLESERHVSSNRAANWTCRADATKTTIQSLAEVDPTKTMAMWVHVQWRQAHHSRQEIHGL